MSAETCTGPISWRSSFMAENTGRSGQPVQKVGGRAGRGAPRALSTSARCASTRRSIARARARRGHSVVQKAASPLPTTSGVYSPAIGSTSLPCSLVCRSALRRIWPTACSMKSGAPSSTTSTAFLPAQKPADLLRHQRMHDVEHQRRHRDVAVDVAEARERQPAVQHVEQAALHDDADVAVGGTEPLVELVVDDEACAPPAGADRSCRPPGGRSPADGSAGRS